MKTNLFKTYFLLFFLSCSFITFAQPSDLANDGNPTDPTLEGTSGDTTPAAPINEKSIWLGFAAISFAYYSYKSNKKAA